MSRTDNWSAKWCQDKLLNHEKILEVSTLSDNSLQLVVEETESPVIVVTMSEKKVDLNTVPDEFHDPDTEFLLNIPKDAFYSGELLSHAESIPVGVGSLGDLYSAANENEFRLYLPKETRFILSALGQHTAVRDISRVNDRTYQITKLLGNSILVLALNEYDLTGETVRAGIDKYGVPNYILASNPYCRFSSETKEVAKSAGTDVLTLKQLMGALKN